MQVQIHTIAMVCPSYKSSSRSDLAIQYILLLIRTPWFVRAEPKFVIDIQESLYAKETSVAGISGKSGHFLEI